jgi:hypothetical protein
MPTLLVLPHEQCLISSKIALSVVNFADGPNSSLETKTCGKKRNKIGIAAITACGTGSSSPGQRLHRPGTTTAETR